MTRERPGRVAVVTGASRGIGEATARTLAAEGATVVLAARSGQAIDAIAADLRDQGARTLAVETDLSSGDSRAALVSAVEREFGRVDVLVNNAGTLPKATRAERLRPQDWTGVLDVNLSAPFFLTQGFKPLFREGSVVVNVTSTAASYPSVGLAPYCVSKAGLEMLTRVLALEWAREGIRVVGVAPGKVDTELGRPVLRYTEASNLPYNPLGRVGTPAEVARLISFLTADAASFITGTTYVIDGGELLSAAR